MHLLINGCLISDIQGYQIKFYIGYIMMYSNFLCFREELIENIWKKTLSRNRTEKFYFIQFTPRRAMGYGSNPFLFDFKSIINLLIQ